MQRNTLLHILTVLTTFTLPVQPWGSLGHRTVTAVALAHFSADDPIHTLLSWLLNSQDPTTASLFPDRIRYIPSFAYTAPWHYIDAHDSPPSHCSVNLTRDCPLAEGGCVVTALVNHTARAADSSLPRWQRGQSLRFMLHFFGDAHQPLHAEALARGGNDIPVAFDGVHTNLHSVWDTLIPRKIVQLAGERERERERERDDVDDVGSHALAASPGQWDWDPTNETSSAYAWASFLYARYHPHHSFSNPRPRTPAPTFASALASALSWSRASNALVCSQVLRDGVSAVQARDLGGAYFDAAAPVVERQLFVAGARLARWLDAVVAEGGFASASAPAGEEGEGEWEG